MPRPMEEGRTQLAHRITLIPGDGIGPEVDRGHPPRHRGHGGRRRRGTATRWAPARSPAPGGRCPPTRVDVDPRDTASRSRVRSRRPITSGLRSVNLTLRQELDLFANVRPCRLYPGVPSVYDDVDLVVVRENTEGMYTGVRVRDGHGRGEGADPVRARTPPGSGSARTAASRSSRSASTGASASCGSRSSGRIAHGRTKVTASHKANIMKFSDGLFLEVARRVAAQEYPDMAFDDRIIDALCMQLIQAPGALRRPGDAEPLRRHRRGAGGGSVRGRRAWPPGAHFGGRDGRELAVFEATHGTAHAPGGHEPGGSVRSHAVGRHDAAPHRRARGGRPPGGRRGRRADRRGYRRARGPPRSRRRSSRRPAPSRRPTP